MSTIDRFAAEYQVVNAISPRRSREQLAVLRRFVAFTERPLEDTTADDVRAWIVSVSGRLMPTSIGTYLKALRGALRWCHDTNLLSTDEWLAIAAVPAPAGASAPGVPNPYSRKDLDRFWRELDEAFPYGREYFITRFRNGTSPYKRIHHHSNRLQLDAIVSLALYQGLRRHEIFRLAIEDLHPDNLGIVVDGKRENWRPKLREVPYSEPAREAVTRWLSWRRLLGPEHDSPWLRLTPQIAGRLAPMYFRKWEMLLHDLGSGWEFHRFRHTAATERLRAGMPLEQLQRFMGHANIEQTLRYAKIVNDDVAKTVGVTDQAFDLAVRARAA